MIFKYCAWSDEAKEPPKDSATMKDRRFDGRSANSWRKENKIADTVLRYCPCAFRCRQSVGIAEKEDEDSISTIVTTANTTPVIPLTLNTSNDTMYVHQKCARNRSLRRGRSGNENLGITGHLGDSM